SRLVPPARVPVFPYTTLFRSVDDTHAVRFVDVPDPLPVEDRRQWPIRRRELDEVGPGPQRTRAGRDRAVALRWRDDRDRLGRRRDRKSTRLNSSHQIISYAAL